MVYRVQLLKGLLHPYYFSRQLQQAEAVRGIKLHTTLLVIVSLIIYSLSAYYGLTTDALSKEMTDFTVQEFEARKALFAIGRLLLGIFFPAVMLLIPPFFFWILFDEVDFNKLFVLQLMVLPIYLLEKAVLIPLEIFYGIDWASSPFSLGVIIQYITSKELFVYFFGAISLFQLWAMMFLYKVLRTITETKPYRILITVVSIHLFFWIVSAVLSSIHFEKIL